MKFLCLVITGFMLSFPAVQVDGPYVSYRNDHVFVHYIKKDNDSTVALSDSMPISGKKDISLRVNTDVPGHTFTVKLKEQLTNEPAEFPAPARQLILSDLEGNFAAFRNLLQANGVIDTAFNWTFGDGHLVLIGDFVDRGEQVTELLWLIYSLEDKAKSAGGYVHYILGNHEIMILSGDTRYVNPRYKASARLLNTKYEGLYDENSELGRWLRTKNIMQKIGDNLFIHAGISEEMNRLRLSIRSVNDLARPFYGDSLYKYPDKKLPLIYGDLGPFWYRGYYQSKPTPDTDLPAQVNKTLSRYRVKHIFTGHSIVADTISAWYGGKVVNTDVHHAEGKSEAVLIENGRYHRVNSKGEKVQLSVQ
jgi:hypothetical protein